MGDGVIPNMRVLRIQSKPYDFAKERKEVVELHQSHGIIEEENVRTARVTILPAELSKGLAPVAPSRRR